MRINCRKYGILAGLLLCAAGAATTQAASSLVTFSVDMSAQITGGTFVPGTDTVAARGTFNGYGTLNLVQVGSTSVYTNTVNDTLDANGAVMQYKYWNSNPSTPNGGWELPAHGNNRFAVLPSVSGGSLPLPTPYFSDAGTPVNNNVTFQIDMAEQEFLGVFNPGGGDTVEIRGALNSWAGTTLNQDTAQTGAGGGQTIFTNTITVTGSPNSISEFKYVRQPGTVYESPSPTSGDPNNNENRYVLILNSPAQTLPTVLFSDAPYVATVTNAVLFQVDMTAQVLGGSFNPATEFVCVNGALNNWTAGVNYLSNNPSGPNPNLYTNIISYTNGLGSPQQYKFVIFDGVNTFYENLSPSTPQIGGNRFFNMVHATTLTLGPYYFSDASPNDLLPSSVSVTFSVDMTGAMGNGGYSFTAGSDTVYLNGDFVPPIPENSMGHGWWTWGGVGDGFQPFPSPPPPTGYLMTRVGTSSIYRLTTTIPQWNQDQITYKYGINGFDDEASSGNNHVRYVRTLGSYTMPQDTWGIMTVEQSFGNLAIGAPSAGRIPVTWLGRPGVHLQTRTSLSSGSWTDVLGTDAQSSTNYPVGGNSSFFRLIKP